MQSNFDGDLGVAAVCPECPFLVGVEFEGVCADPLTGRRERPVPASPVESPNALCQWQEFADGCFKATTKTYPLLSPGLYVTREDALHGVYLYRVPGKTGGVLRLPDMETGRVVAEVTAFWEAKAAYARNGVAYRRGILLYGSPGGGKSSSVRLVCDDCVERGGVVILMTNPHEFEVAVQEFRRVQPETPLVAVLEDIDAIIERYNESVVLNLVDGVTKLDNIVFLATTNYPERLGGRVINRPSRFDVRIKVGMPTEAARRTYLEAQFVKGGDAPDTATLDHWAKDTKGFSIAHLLELYVGVALLGKAYDAVLAALQEMYKTVSSDDDNQKLGLAR